MPALIIILGAAVIWLGIAVLGTELGTAFLNEQPVNPRAMAEGAAFLLAGMGLVVVGP